MLVSIIIPCYNSDRFIEDTIQSLLNQNHKEIEIICVDNGSTDNTLDILKEFSEAHSFFSYYEESKKGASYARNKGLQFAKGDLIQYLDSDDIILPEKLNSQIEFLKHNSLDIVVSDRSVMDQKMENVLEHHSYEDIEDNPLSAAIARIITSGNPLYKKSIVDQVEGYTAYLKVGQDWDFHIKLFLSGAKIGYLKGDFFHSRRVENSLSSNWFEVSRTVAALILKYKKQFVDLEMQNNEEAYRKIVQVYLFTAFFTSDKKLLKLSIEEIQFWSSKYKVKIILGGMNKIVHLIFGLKGHIYLRRLISKKLS